MLEREIPLRDDGRSAFTQLQAFLSQIPHDSRGQLPPERELCELLGVSRSALRKALALAEAEGKIWRHVGKGTFIGTKPIEDRSETGRVAHNSSPAEVLRARLILEPVLAREAAIHASVADLSELELGARNCRSASTWRRYESWDNRFHRTVATATQNRVLLLLFDELNDVRRAMAWGRRRDGSTGPGPEHHSLAEHERIVSAIRDRDPALAESSMRAHILTVSRKLLDGEKAADIPSA